MECSYRDQNFIGYSAGVRPTLISPMCWINTNTRQVIISVITLTSRYDELPLKALAISCTESDTVMRNDMFNTDSTKDNTDRFFCCCCLLCPFIKLMASICETRMAKTTAINSSFCMSSDARRFNSDAMENAIEKDTSPPSELSICADCPAMPAGCNGVVRVEVRTMLVSHTRKVDSDKLFEKRHISRVLGFTLGAIVQAACRCGVAERRVRRAAAQELQRIMRLRRSHRQGCRRTEEEGDRTSITSGDSDEIGDGYALDSDMEDALDGKGDEQQQEGEEQRGKEERLTTALDTGQGGTASTPDTSITGCNLKDYQAAGPVHINPVPCRKRYRMRSLDSSDLSIGLTAGVLLLFKILLSDPIVAGNMRADAFLNSALLIRQTVHTQLLQNKADREQFASEMCDFEHGLIAARIEGVRYGAGRVSGSATSAAMLLREQLEHYARYAWARTPHTKRQHMMCCAYVVKSAGLPNRRTSFLLEWVERAPCDARRALALKRVLHVVGRVILI